MSIYLKLKTRFLSIFLIGIGNALNTSQFNNNVNPGSANEF